MFDYNAELVRCLGIDIAPVHLVTGALLVSADNPTSTREVPASKKGGEQ